jgi:excisionase family DNA binding protein
MESYVTVSQVAEIMGVSTSTIYKLIDSKDIPSNRVNGKLRIPGTYQDWIFERLRTDVTESWKSMESYLNHKWY